MSKRKGLAWLAAAVAVGAGAAVGLPSLARHVPWSVERRLADLAGAPVRAGRCHANGAADAALAHLVSRLYPLDAEDRALPITVEVLPGPTVNAFASLGGHIYVFDGLLRQAQSPDELAGVLAHEIAHVRERHIIQGAVVNLFTWGALVAGSGGDAETTSEIAYLLLTMKFSRGQEAQADADGLERLRRAHVDADGLARFFARLAALPSVPALIGSHPASEDRATLAARYSGYPTQAALAPAEWDRLLTLCR